MLRRVRPAIPVPATCRRRHTREWRWTRRDSVRRRLDDDHPGCLEVDVLLMCCKWIHRQPDGYRDEGLLCRLAGARVRFRSSFCAVASLLQLDHRIARGGFASRLPIRLVRLAVELSDHRDKHHRRARIAFHGLPCAHRFCLHSFESGDHINHDCLLPRRPLPRTPIVRPNFSPWTRPCQRRGWRSSVRRGSYVPP